MINEEKIQEIEGRRRMAEEELQTGNVFKLNWVKSYLKDITYLLDELYRKEQANDELVFSQKISA